jgi:uncharacterized protein YlxW (UPF0749 family)
VTVLSPGSVPREALSAARRIRDSVDNMREQVLTLADELEQLQRRLESYESLQS